MELWIACAHGKNYVEVAWGSHQHTGSERRSCLDNFPGWRPNRTSFASKKDHGIRLSQLWASSDTSHTMTLWPININATKSREPWCMQECVMRFGLHGSQQASYSQSTPQVQADEFVCISPDTQRNASQHLKLWCHSIPQFNWLWTYNVTQSDFKWFKNKLIESNRIA